MKSELDRRQAEMRSRWTRKKRLHGPQGALTEKQIFNARKMHRQGRTYQEIADYYRIHRDTARKYVLQP